MSLEVISLNSLNIFGINLIFISIFSIKTIKTQCLDVNPPRGGFTAVRCVQVLPGFECVFSCKQGCTLIPPSSITCNSNGWNPPVPGPNSTCRPQDCPQRSIPNGNTCLSTRAGTTCIFTCNPGYQISGKTTLECIFDDSVNCLSYWEETPLPVCTPMRCSSDLVRPINGYLDPNCPRMASINQECRIFCNPGYTVVSNNPTIVCTTSGWSQSDIWQTFCQQLRCPDLIARDYLNFVDINQCRNAVPGSRCQFNCPNGYSLNPNMNYLDCNGNGQWSAQLPSCASIQCESLLIPTNGKLSGECIKYNTRLNSVCTLYCYDNCYLSGNTDPMEFRCIGQGFNNGWDRQIPNECLRPPNCDPTTVQFASSCPTTPIGGTCAVNCLPGYQHFGNNILSCVENPQANANEICLKPFWSPSPSSQSICTRTVCPDITNSFGNPAQGVCMNAVVDDVCTWICGPGYRNPLNNGQQMTARCQTNGQWDGPIQCVQVTCPSLQRPVDGTYTDATCDPGRPGSFCQFYCFDRYTLDPPTFTSILCQDDGTWSNGGYVPRCVSKPDCENVADLLYAKKSGHCVTTADNQLKVGSVCNIICYVGCYLNDGSNAIDLNCIDFNGITRWDKPIPTQCLQQTQCQPFGPIEDGSSCGLAYVNEICTLNCNPGFSLIGYNVFTCILPSNPDFETCTVPQWSIPPESGKLPVCAAILCVDLSNIVIENGGINAGESCTSGRVGAVCTFFCNTDYVLNGWDSTECQTDGSWNNVPPTCNLGIIQCDGLAPIENGVQEGVCDPGKSGEKCTYLCNEGFALVGESEFLCTPDTTWDKQELPSCTEIFCEQIEIDNAQGVCAIAKPGQKCINTCTNGDSFELTCTDTGEWSGEVDCPPPPDIVNCDDLEDPENGLADGTCAPGVASEACTFTCSESFELEGESELTCGEDGAWSAEPPICKPVGCKGIIPLPNVNLMGDCNPGVADKKCTLSCKTSPSSIKTITCQPDGQWSDSIDTFKCGGSGCPPVHLPNGGKNIRFCSPGTLGKRCEMGCGKGFKINGKNTLLCTMNGKWVGKTARCLRQCKPIHGINGRLSGQCSPTGLQSKYCSLRCNPGFALAGPRTALCGSRGIWAPTVPRCLRRLSDCR